MSDSKDEPDLRAALEGAAPYPMEAFAFVREGLDHTVRHLHGEMPEGPIDEDEIQDRHVDGRELSLGLLDYSVRKYGLMAEAVLRHWNITRTDDFGRIVFAMIEQGMMSRTDDDVLEDFFAVRPFSSAFAPGLRTMHGHLLLMYRKQRNAHSD